MKSQMKNEGIVNAVAAMAFHWFHNLSARAKYISLSVLIGVLGATNYNVGYEFGFSFFYLFPVSIAAWFISIRAGFWTCFLCGLLWGLLDIDLGHEYSNQMYSAWNIFMRISFYLVVVKLLEAVRMAFDNERILSQTDFLTGLFNRRFIYDCIDRNLMHFHRSGQNFVLVYIDLDNFKKLNDSKGHTEGDRALKVIGHCMNLTLRKTDWIGRVGGDEFIVLLTNTNLDESKNILKRLNSVLLTEMKVNRWPITFSMGALAAEPKHKNVDEIVSSVDRLMYQVKEKGKDSICFEAA